MSFLRNIAVILLLVIPLTLQAQHREPVDLEMVNKIKNEALNNSSIRDLAFYLTDVIGPRLSGSTGLQNAYEWTSSQMIDWGLENVEVVPWGDFGRGWDNEKFYIAMTEPYYQHLIGVPQAWTRGTDGFVSTEPVLVDISSEEDLERYRGKLEGKVVVTPISRDPEMDERSPVQRYDDEDLEELAKLPRVPNPRYSQGPRSDNTEVLRRRALMQKVNQFFEEEGVVAVLSSGGTFGTVRSHGRGYSMDAEPGIAQIALTAEHYGRIVRLLEEGIDVGLELEVRNRFLEEDTKGYNVIGEIPGTDRNLRDEVVMIGGHLDSWHGGTGGNDNAAGVVLMMEVMRILKELEIEPRRTIRIALWGAEEQGLHGSRNYVAEHFYDRSTGEKKADFDNLSAYFNVDNGSGKIRGIWLMGNDAARPIFEQLLEPFHDMGATTVTLRNTGGTDHLAFDRAGLPGFNMLQDRLDYWRGYHTNMDTLERMQLGNLMQGAAIVASLVYHVAQRDEKIPREAFDH